MEFAKKNTAINITFLVIAIIGSIIVGITSYNILPSYVLNKGKKDKQESFEDLEEKYKEVSNDENYKKDNNDDN